MSTTKVTDLASCRIANCITVPTGIDKNNYIIIDYDGHQSKQIECIYKYNIDTDKWNKINDFNNMENISWFSAALDVKKQTLFLFHCNCLRQFHLYTNHIAKYERNTRVYSPATTTSIILNNSLLIVGGVDNNSILKWNFESKTLTKFSDMYNKMKIGNFAMIYNHKNNCLLLFGGFDYDNIDRVDYILEFNINTKQWNKLEVSLPKKMDNICCTMAVNNEYILLFGGRDNTYDYCDNIYIYSLKHKTLTQSKMRCPSKSKFVAITVNDDIKDEKLVFGYVRNQYRICNLSNHYYPTNCLIKLMHSYYSNEFVYLLDINNYLDKKTQKHYKMNVLDIV